MNPSMLAEIPATQLGLFGGCLPLVSNFRIMGISPEIASLYAVQVTQLPSFCPLKGQPIPAHWYLPRSSHGCVTSSFSWPHSTNVHIVPLHIVRMVLLDCSVLADLDLRWTRVETSQKPEAAVAELSWADLLKVDRRGIWFAVGNRDGC